MLQKSDMRFEQLENKKILLLTEVFFGSGDFHAGRKWLVDLKKRIPDSDISWFIGHPKTRLDVPKKIEQYGEQLKGISVANGEWRALEDYLKTNNNFDLVVMFPTLHYIMPHTFQHLTSLKVPILHVFAYDELMHSHHLPSKYQLTSSNLSGFSGLGLFFEKDFTLSKPVDKTSKIVIDLIDKPNSMTFFSYLNMEANHVINEGSIENFIRTAARITPADKSITIITNQSDRVLKNKSLLAELKKLGLSEFICMTIDKDGKVTNEAHYGKAQQGQQTRSITIINPFPIPHKLMLYTMAHSHELINVTGNQSFTEALFLAGEGFPKFPFYQTMFWNVGVVDAWCKTAKVQLGKKSPYVNLIEQIQKKKIDIDSFVSTWQEYSEKINEHATLFYNNVKDENNLYDNFSAFLEIYLRLKADVSTAFLKLSSDLIIQLIKKSRSVDKVCEAILELHKEVSSEDVANICKKLTNLLCYSAFDFDISYTALLAKQLMAIPQHKRLHISNYTRLILNMMSATNQDMSSNWQTKLIPLLKDMPLISYRTKKIMAQIQGDLSLNQEFSQDTQLNEKWFSDIINDPLYGSMQDNRVSPQGGTFLSNNMPHKVFIFCYTCRPFFIKPGCPNEIPQTCGKSFQSLP